MRWQGRSRKKHTGGRYRIHRKKKVYEMGRDPIPTHLSQVKRKKIRTRGGGQKVILLGGDIVNVTDPQTGKAQGTKIKTVLENSADPHFIRRNIITKGAILDTDIGKVRVTSRPGQDGVISGILTE
ncbi:MAG: 30S ribosomal protein S8e [Candidatus Methanolliviera hydrocarbonicum]|uniref:Small ribosomal subunit protein eS8 n=1 Tax=Candidatus Methanolliviera hydrocarbonicum TaxID=2491085 RepID=A0A520KXJ4_9EURY|nr:MAG: 30S ribosomal protein S8e [Candidatus Methanolliviera hydrocarbonicum]